MLPDTNTSDSVFNAIKSALEEEKRSPMQLWTKIIGISLVATFASLLPLFFLLHNDFPQIHLIVAAILWLTIVTFLSALYFKPQPRLVVPGHWSKWVYAKLSFSFLIGNILTFLICPSFVFTHKDYYWNPLQKLTYFLMDMGGMNLCMLFCGALFSTFASLLASLSVKKVLSGTSLKKVISVTLLASITQIPIVYLLFVETESLPFTASWMVGSLTGAVTVSFMTYLFLRKTYLKLSQK